MAESSNLRSKPWATGSAILGFGMLAVYVALIVAEGNNSLFEVFPWTLVMATAAVIAFASLHVADLRIARNLLVGAAALYGLIGAVSIFSIGLGFLLAAALAALGVAGLSSEESR